MPAALLESWIGRGWLVRVVSPAIPEPLPPVPCTVLDPFAGTGTTLAVAVELGQRAIGIELNPAYLPMIRARVENAVEARRIEIGRAPLTGDPAKDAAIEGPRTFF